MSSTQQREQFSPGQWKVYDYMVDYFNHNDQLPTTRNIANHFGWKSQNASMGMLRALARKGWLQRNAADNYMFTRPIYRANDIERPGAIIPGLL